MDVLLTGTGGVDGWPQPGCGCASCRRASAADLRRKPGRVVVDGVVEFRPGQPPSQGTGAPAAAAHRIDAVPGGFDITGPDGSRLLLAAGPGAQPQPPTGAAPYDVALLDLLDSPAQLGRLRQAGFVHAQTAVVAMYTDHRVSSAAELARRCTLWQASHGADDQLISGTSEPQQRADRPQRTLIIGGARSGKSTEAELRLAAEPNVTYVAAGPWRSWTGADGQPDTEWAERVARHRARRPSWWQTTETLDIASELHRSGSVLLIDGIGTWLAGVMESAGLWQDSGRQGMDQPPADVVRAEIDDLVEAWRQTAALVVAVTDEAGSGLVPAYPAGRVFRDELGWLNQRLAAESELVLHVVAGRLTTLPG
ncbi:MAG TPA: bifunctional adenosylcobinamide kinase/adenosylcobinamide-phosphate guanylyltransferase [Streptosporangiaceae bacterium]